MRSLRRVPPDENELGPLLTDPRRALRCSAMLLAGAALLCAWSNWTGCILVVAVLLWRKQWLQLTAFVLAVATSEALISPVKELYDRPRPAAGLTSTSGAAFPSGHAAAAAVTAVGLVLVLLPPGHRRSVWERRAAYYASLVASSRCYLADHWLSDVVAGGLLGSGIAIG